jgi:hypothetical protein
MDTVVRLAQIKSQTWKLVVCLRLELSVVRRATISPSDMPTDLTMVRAPWDIEIDIYNGYG